MLKPKKQVLEPRVRLAFCSWYHSDMPQARQRGPLIPKGQNPTSVLV